MKPNLSNFTERLKASAAEGYQALELSEEFVAELEAITADTPAAIQVRPHKDGGGIEAGRGLLESLHTVDTTRFRGRNVSPAHSFEVTYSDEEETINLQFVPGTEKAHADFDVHITDEYPNAITERIEPELLPFEAGHYVAGAEMELKRYTLYPIKNQELDGFRRDPYGSITSEMVGSAAGHDAPVNVVSQVLFRPVDDDWIMGVGGESVQDLAFSLRQPSIEYRRKTFTKERLEHPPSKQDKQVADMLESLAGEKGWSLNLRVYAVSADPEAAVARAEKVANKFRNYYETSTRQRFEPVPLRGKDLKQGVRRAVAREYNDQRIVKSEAETAGLVHCMDDQINTQKFNWAMANPGDGVPPHTARYDFKAAGVEHASDEEKALAMIDHPEYGDDALWFGFGRMSGTEAGVYEKFLNAHMQITGRTRMGKTTAGTNIGSQVMKRGYGCLAIMMGKQDDDEAFIAEFPGDRPEEDFVFIDTGDSFERRARFNLLEIPDELEPGTAEHTSYMESMADDFCAAFAQAGGGEETLYPLMRGITRTLVRGMAQSEMTCTPLDLAAACSSAENMDLFSQWMTDERIAFIEDTAERFAEKEDADLEPIARRMDEITHNANLRTWLAAREPTVRIQNIVNEGKVAVLRIDPALGETERKFATTPVVRRFAHAKKMAYDSGENTDPFYVIWDEADKALSVHSNLGGMLSEYGGYGLRICLMYQAPSNQLPEQLKDATESQIDTTISFRTTGKDARFIANQHPIDKEDLTRLPRYSFYMTTDREDGEPTESYMVRGYRPVRELRQDLEGVDPMTSDEIAAMKRRSTERYGDVPPTDEEIKAQSHFYADELDDEDPDASALGRAAALQAVYDEGFYADDPDGFVTLDEASERITRYLERVGVFAETPSQIEGVLGRIPETLLARDRGDGVLRVRTTDEGKMQFLSPVSDDEDDEINENTGGFEHAEIMRAAYDDFLELNLPLQVLHQEGDNAPDARAIPDVEEYHSIVENPGVEPGEVVRRVEKFRDEHPLLDRLTDASAVDIEAEHSTGDSAPGATLEHIHRSTEAGRRCLLLAWPDTAAKIARRLDRKPRGMRSFDEPRAPRLYNANGDVRAGPDELKVYRRGDGQNVWLYHDDGSVELRANGETIATFDSPADVFEDADAYPATEKDISDFSKWSSIKRPAFPPERDMVDVIAVTDDVLCVLEDGEEKPLDELVVDGEDKDGQQRQSAGGAPELNF